MEKLIDFICDKAIGTSNASTQIAALDISFHHHSYIFRMARKFSRVSYCIVCSALNYSGNNVYLCTGSFNSF